MEFFEEADEILSFSEESITDAGEEDALLDSESDVVAEATEGTSRLSQVLEGLKKLGNLGLDFTKFVVKITAVGAIFYGVTVAMKKLTAAISGEAGGDSAATKQKATKIKAMSQFLTSSSELAKEVSEWLAAHKDNTITLDGIDVLIVAIFNKYTKPLENVSARVI